MTEKRDEVGLYKKPIKYSMDLVEIGLETAKYKILGTAFLYKDKRFSDSLNNGRSFIILRDAKVFSLGSKMLLYEKDYLMVNKDSILLSWEEK